LKHSKELKTNFELCIFIACRYLQWTRFYVETMSGGYSSVRRKEKTTKMHKHKTISQYVSELGDQKKINKKKRKTEDLKLYYLLWVSTLNSVDMVLKSSAWFFFFFDLFVRL